MTNSPDRDRALVISAAMLGLAACSTKEIGPGQLIIPDSAPSADHGALLIAFAPRELSYAEYQRATASTGRTTGYVFYDGAQLASDEGGHVQPLVAWEGGTTGMGYLPGGLHHFVIGADLGRTTVFASNGEIPAGSLTLLYLFGPAGNVQGRFVSYPPSVAPGSVHVSLINLVRTGQSLEVVGCMDASHCVPLSSPLALGETFAGDFPMDATQDWPNGRYVISNGAALGYRQVPTPAVPTPPVKPVAPGVSLDPSLPSSTTLMAAPIYMSATGDVQSYF